MNYYTYLTYKELIIMILIMLLFSTNETYAYIDPGSGSMILQVIIAVILGAVTAIKIYWNKIKNMFSKNSNNKNIED